MAARRKTYAVNWSSGLNVRERPSQEARILRVLADGQKITIDNDATVPEGWKAIQGGGYVMAAYLK